MRILGTIDHPRLKITVFKMDNRISVKFENEGYEQTIKLGMDERFNNLETIQKWVDAVLLDDVSQLLQRLHQARLAVTARAFPEEAGAEFEEII